MVVVVLIMLVMTISTMIISTTWMNDTPSRRSRRDGRLVTKCIIRAWRTVILERIMGCDLSGMADILRAVKCVKRMSKAVGTDRDASSGAAARPLAAAAATKRTCQWAAHAERRRRQLMLATIVGGWTRFVRGMKQGR